MSAIKGKIKFRENLTLNFSNQAQVYCHFSEFSENNPVSQILKYVTVSLRKLTQNSFNMTSLDRCIGLMDGVEPKVHLASTLDRTSKNNRDINFGGLINLAKMFLQKLQPDFHGSKKDKVFSLLFDMNELFENFIFEVLRRNSKALGVQVFAQKKKRLVSAEREIGLRSEWKKRQLFDTYTDIILVREDGEAIIIDTKYKIISSSKNHYGVSNSDVYQVMAYSHIHHHNTKGRLVLAYPLASEIIKKEFQLNESTSTFEVWTLDIAQDLNNTIDEFVREIKELLTA